MDTSARTSFLAAGLLTGALLLTGCGRDPAGNDEAALQVWPLPAAAGSAQPDLSVSHDGRLLVSWLRQQADGRTALQYADFSGDGAWSPARTIAVGRRFFVNRVDTPHVRMTPDGAVWAQWLQKVGGEDAGAHGYHVILSTSRDGGVNWSAPARVHADDSQTEHGFAALWPASAQQLGIAWLDGGAMQGDAGGRMQLRSTVIEPGLVASQDASEQVIDASSCECCPTDVAISARGPVLVWRGRNDAQVRDIHVSRFESGNWRTPMPVHADGWRIEGCPVNGPAVDAAGERVLVGWFTAADDTPAVQLALSNDAGDGFAAPLRLDEGDQVLGRIDVAIDDTHAWALWVRQDDGMQSLWLARFSADLGNEIERVQVATIAGNGRTSGIPKLALRDGTAFVVWTDVDEGGGTQLRGARYRPLPPG
ncbi:MAG: hypothetical protein Q4F49_01200 [Pseudoxanthomonas suwonensis]|nr:hypothetical protein [Pseudoxanthomonas suwonensis]